MGAKTIPVDHMSRSLTIQALTEILEGLGYERLSDYIPLTGPKDIFEFTRGEEKIILTLDKRGEREENLIVQGPDDELNEIIVKLAVKSTFPIYRNLLGSISEADKIDNFLEEINDKIKRFYLEGKR